jgi:hypothetical protein
MTDLELIIRNAIDDIVAATPPAADDLPRQQSRGAERRSVWRTVAVGAAAASIVVAGLGYLVTRPIDHENDAAATQPSSPGPATVTTPAFPVIYLPPPTLAGFDVGQAAEQPATSADNSPFGQLVIGEKLVDGGFGPLIRLTSGSPDAVLLTDGELEFDRRSVVLDGGVSAEFLWFGDSNRALALQYTAPSGRAVMIMANAETATDPIADVLIAIADSATAGDRVEVEGPLPAPYEVLAANDELDTGGPSWWVTYRDRTDLGRQFVITSRAQPPSGFPISVGINDPLSPIAIRGHTGFISRHDYLECECPTIVITWLERPDLQLTIAGDSMTEDELLAIANSLQPAGEDRWTAISENNVTDTAPATIAP